MVLARAGAPAVTESHSGGGHASARVAARAAALLVFWVVIHGADAADLAVGVLTALLASWASARLLPAGRWRPRLLAVAGIIVRFLWQSLVAGTDVAWRALQVRPALQPGFVACPVALAAGPARSAFCAFESLMPGTMPTGFDTDGRLLMHCLDVSRPVAADLQADRRRLARAFGGTADD